MVSPKEWNVDINIKSSLCGKILVSPDSLLQLVTIITNIILKAEIPVFVFFSLCHA